MQAAVLIIPVYWGYLLSFPSKQSSCIPFWQNFILLSNVNVFLCFLLIGKCSFFWLFFWIKIRPVVSFILIMDYQNFLSLGIMLWVTERLHCTQRVAPFWWGLLWAPLLSHSLLLCESPLVVPGPDFTADVQFDLYIISPISSHRLSKLPLFWNSATCQSQGSNRKDQGKRSFHRQGVQKFLSPLDLSQVWLF